MLAPLSCFLRGDRLRGVWALRSALGDLLWGVRKQECVRGKLDFDEVATKASANPWILGLECPAQMSHSAPGLHYLVPGGQDLGQ